jgi:DNA-binding NtrC family response regulator
MNMDRMAIIIGNQSGGSAIVPMLEREGMHVEVTGSPEQALERLQAIVEHRPPGLAPETAEPVGAPGEGGNGGTQYEQAGGTSESQAQGGLEPGAGGLALDRRLAAVQERARALEIEEQKIINEALQHAGGNKTAAARLLGISRYALQRRLRRFGKPQAPML